MSSTTISEEDFLLTELRYTLGQLHVQVLDLDEATRTWAADVETSIESILSDMLGYEKEYQSRYATLVHVSASHAAGDEHSILPVNAVADPNSEENRFEHERSHTIALLEQANTPWPSELLAAVKDHVQQDRQHTTKIAEYRRRYFEQDQRPDLQEPLVPPERDVPQGALVDPTGQP